MKIEESVKPKFSKEKFRHPDWEKDVYMIMEENPGYGSQAMVLVDGRDDELYKELVGSINDPST